MFKFPRTDKFPFIRHKWEDIIGRKAEDTEVLCELHFRSEDIQSNYEILLSSSVHHTMERGKVTLNPTAVPQENVCKNKEFENNELRTATAEIWINQPLQTQEKLIILDQPFENSEIHLESIDASTIPLPSTVMKDSENDININSDTSESCLICLNQPLQKTQEKPIIDQSFENAEIHSESIDTSISPPSTVMKDSENDINTNLDTSESCLETNELELFSLETLNYSLKQIKFPEGWAHLKLMFLGQESIIVGYWHANRPTLKEFVINVDGSVDVFINKKAVSIPGIKPGTTTNNVINNIQVLGKVLLCDGSGIAERHSGLCKGYVLPNQIHFKYNHVRCVPCKKLIAKSFRQQKKQLSQSVKAQVKRQKSRKTVKYEKAKNKRMKTKLVELKAEVARLKKNCAKTNKAVVEKEISHLPQAQQETVRACFSSAKIKSKGRRYTQQWIYECLLMRIKNRKLYEHLRSHEILALPHINTVNKYVKCMGSTYGFSSTMFDMLRKKAEQMEPAEKRGILLADEMKLSEALKFDRDSCLFHGFVNLGDYTPESQEHELGDHALVFMYQPFRGSWVQAVACFLSKGCANSSILQCLVLECIILLEKSGFLCDGVTTDGATWNRSMWKKFGITESNISCQHPCDPDRKLWFLSDFPHLIKNFRNFITSQLEIWTPDGMIKKKHWKAVIESENHPYGLKIAHKLKPDHLDPKYYQKMNVPMAFQLFEDRVAASMSIYREYHPELADCQPTIQFIKRINRLIEVMMSRTPNKALRPGSDEETVITEFIEYLHEWELTAKKNGFYFITESTCYGLKTTLRATLEILRCLTYECNYKYLMTARLNQDALERFFGLTRGVCGSNDHPDSTLFGQMFRLMSMYSLIKPCKGSNVSGGEMLHSLLNFSNIPASQAGRLEWIKIMDSIIEHGKPNNDNMDQIDKQIANEEMATQDSSFSIIEYMAGYLVRKAGKWTKCDDCIQSLRASPNCKDHRMIALLSRGYLIHPSDDLIKLVQLMEKMILDIVKVESINSDTVFHMSYALQELQSELPLVGCPLHQRELTTSVMSFYMIIRADFLAKRYNVNNCTKRQKTRRTRKDAKL